MKWEKVRLGEVSDSCLGKMLDKEKNKGEYQPYLANINVRWGEFDLDNLPLMRFEDRESERYGLIAGDLVICEGGEPGRCALWKGTIPNMKIQKALHRVRAYDCLDNRYLYYWFLNAGKLGALEQYFTGATIKHMPGDKLKSVMIDLPPLSTQHRIADILSAYDDLIGNDQKQIKLLEEAAMRLYKEWFVKLRFPGYETMKIIEGVPEGWGKCPIKDLGCVITGKTPPTSVKENYGGSIPFVKIPDMHGVIYPLETEITLSDRGAKTQPCKFLPPNSIMVSCIATVGLVCIAHEPCQTNQQINSIILYNDKYLYYAYFKMAELTELLKGVGSNGATMTNVNKAKFENLKLLFPDKNIIEAFNIHVEPMFKNIYSISKQIRSLRQSRDILLPKLMSGEKLKFNKEAIL